MPVDDDLVPTPVLGRVQRLVGTLLHGDGVVAVGERHAHRDREAPTGLPADHPPIVAAGTEAPRHLAPDTVMARVGAEVVTAGEVDAAINAVAGPERLEYRSPAPLRDMVEALVDRKLMAQAARAAGMSCAFPATALRPISTGASRPSRRAPRHGLG